MLYGRCFGGHLHQIKIEKVKLASNRDILTDRSSMFHETCINETEISPENFIPLPPIQCPKLTVSTFMYKPPNEASKEPYKVLKDSISTPNEILPYTGETDLRSAPQFIYFFERNIDRTLESYDESKFKLYDLIHEVFPLEYQELLRLKYHDLRQEFLLQFWSVEEQYKLYAEFRASFNTGRKVGRYIANWIGSFLQIQTIILPQTFVKKLMVRVPISYAFQLARYEKGVDDWITTYQAIRGKEKDRIVIFQCTVY